MSVTAPAHRVADARAIGCPSSGNFVAPDLQTLLRRAIEQSALQYKVVAACLMVPPWRLSQMLSGEKPCSLDHLERLPDVVFLNFFKLAIEATGRTVSETDPFSLALADLQQAITRVLLFANGPKKMAKVRRA